MNSSYPIRTIPYPLCHVCSSPGELVYVGLQDRLFGVPGAWNVRKCSNTDCRTTWLDPMPMEADLPKLYASYYTHLDSGNFEQNSFIGKIRKKARATYLQLKFKYHQGRLSVWDHLLGGVLSLNPIWRANADFSAFHLPAKPGGKLLEVGCGSGAMLEQMAALNWNVTGIDFDSVVVERAQSKGLAVFHGDLSSQRFEDEAFDAVVMSHVIEHVLSPRELLRECRRILKKGGMLVSITPNLSSQLHQYYGSNWMPLDPPRHLHLFSSRALERLGLELDYHNVKVFPSLHGSSYVWLASRQIARSGCHRMDGKYTLAERVMAQIMGITFALRGLRNPAAREELVLTAIK